MERSMKTQIWDEGTKKRLIEAAGETFAVHGFRAASIREICRHAKASVSAVNYHFRDKKGLYEAVLEYSHRRAVEKYPHDLGLENEATLEERLRAFIRSLLLRGLGDGFPAWHAKLMAQEMANPTGVLSSELAERAIRPMDEYLDGIVRELFRKNDPSREPDAHSVELCRMNIIGQCFVQFHARQLKEPDGPKSLEPRQIKALSDQICRFSLGGIRAVAAGGAF